MKNSLKQSNKLKKVFFYAFEDIKYYNGTIDLVCPYYQLMHKMCSDLVTEKFGSRPISLLDIGAGTGAESIRILKSNYKTRIIAIDISHEMKDEFYKDAARKIPEYLLKENVQYVVRDFMEFPKNEILKLNNDKKFDLIITAYTIHHYSISDKKKIYYKILDLLKNNGMFINIDLFKYDNKKLSEISHNYDIKWIKEKFENPNIISRKEKKIPLSIRKELKKRWIAHYEKNNVLDTYESQKKILIKGKSSSVEMPFRFYQNGLMVSIK